MTRPLTCLTLLAAAGAGLYLYQEKHLAAMLDHEINRVVHATEQTRERTGMLRAELALLSEPDRLANLAAQHMALQPVTPQQFAQLADLGARLPPVGAPVQPPAALETSGPVATTATPAPAKLEAVKPDGARPVLPLAAQIPGAVLPPRPNTPLMVSANLPPHPPRRERVAAKVPEPESRPVYAPVVQAFDSRPPMVRQPTMQQASAGLPTYAAPPSYAGSSYAAAAPFTGSSLGMAHSYLAAPVPVGTYLAQ